MRRVVKKWGNGLAIRLPKEDPEYGRLREGMEIDVHVKSLADADPDWEPPTFDSGIEDLSQRIDEVAWGYMKEKYG